MTWRLILSHVMEASWDKLIHFTIVPYTRIIVLYRIRYAGKNNDKKTVSYSDAFFENGN